MIVLGSIILPWPPRALHPNDRTDRRRATNARRSYLRGAWSACHEAGLVRLGVTHLHLVVTAHPPDRRRRDMDGVLSSIKPGIDGIALATGADDSTYSYTLRWGDREPGGKVRINVHEHEPLQA